MSGSRPTAAESNVALAAQHHMDHPDNRLHDEKQRTLRSSPLALGEQLWAVGLTQAAAVLVPRVVTVVVKWEADVLGDLGQRADEVAEHLGRLQDKNLGQTRVSEHTWQQQQSLNKFGYAAGPCNGRWIRVYHREMKPVAIHDVSALSFRGPAVITAPRETPTKYAKSTQSSLT